MNPKWLGTICQWVRIKAVFSFLFFFSPRRYVLTPSCDFEDDAVPFAASSAPEDLGIGVSTLCKAFPWHFILDRDLDIIQLGSGFSRMFGRGVKIIGVNYTRFFKIKKPKGIFSNFEDIIKRANTPFLLMILSGSAKVRNFFYLHFVF